MSSYIALYRKWRPKLFRDVIGQEHITDVLRGEVTLGSVSHAYLFCGSRGTGKTTCAKILARAVSCEHPIDGDPCGECEMCKRSLESFDIAEIDAASNNGVDNIRSLREEVMYPPSELKRRVYIIDEVHMLSQGAFNALLKTLEEPPSHVLFILATTELNKIPATILSRCKRFDFHRITPENICRGLTNICAEEKIPMSQGALLLISRLSTGAMRDALSMLELFVGAKEEVSEEMCAKALGVIGRGPVMKLLGAVSDNNAAEALSVIKDAYNGSKDMGILLTECADTIRDILVVKYTDAPEKFIEGSSETIQELTLMAQKFTKERLLYSMELLDDFQSRMARTSFSRRAILEACMIRLCDVRLWDLPESINTRLSELEAKLQDGAFSAFPTVKAPEPEFQAELPAPEEEPNIEYFSSKNASNTLSADTTAKITKELPKAVARDSAAESNKDELNVLSCMPEIIEETKLKSSIVGSLLSDAQGYTSGERTVIIKVPSFSYKMLKDSKHNSQLLRDCVTRLMGQVELKIAPIDKEETEVWNL